MDPNAIHPDWSHYAVEMRRLRAESPPWRRDASRLAPWVKACLSELTQGKAHSQSWFVDRLKEEDPTMNSEGAFKRFKLLIKKQLIQRSDVGLWCLSAKGQHASQMMHKHPK